MKIMKNIIKIERKNLRLPPKSWSWPLKSRVNRVSINKTFFLALHYKNISVLYAAISKSGKNDDF